MNSVHAAVEPTFPFQITPEVLRQDNPTERAVLVRTDLTAASRWVLRFFLAAEFPLRATVTVRAVTMTRDHDPPLLGFVYINYGCTYQPFEISFDARLIPSITAGDSLLCRFEFRIDGACDRVESSASVTESAWIIVDDDYGGCFRPCLYAEKSHSELDTATDALLAAVCSPVSLQPFNWLEGCVLDGIGDVLEVVSDSGRANTGTERIPRGDIERSLRFHIDQYFQPDGVLRYVGAGSEARQNEILGIEALLPFAALFRHNLDHAAVPLFLDCVERLYGDDELIIDRFWDPEGIRREPPRVSIEGCYTVAYPLALYGTFQDTSRWDQIAEAQISRRLDYLLRDEMVHQRSFLSGEPMQANWARALCWYLLGTVKTVAVLMPRYDCASLITMWRRVAKHVVAFQRSDGLYSTYLTEPDGGPDTSGSAGIAAAFALGTLHGLLPEEYRRSAERTLHGLVPFIRPDGLLAGVSQLNRGGDEYQRTGPKVIGQFAMGLAAQLWAALQ